MAASGKIAEREATAFEQLTSLMRPSSAGAGLCNLVQRRPVLFTAPIVYYTAWRKKVCGYISDAQSCTAYYRLVQKPIHLDTTKLSRITVTALRGDPHLICGNRAKRGLLVVLRDREDAWDTEVNIVPADLDRLLNALQVLSPKAQVVRTTVQQDIGDSASIGPGDRGQKHEHQ